MNNQKCVKQQSNNEFARPYVNRQVYNKSYSPNMALRKGTLFPELYLVNQIITMIGYIKIQKIELSKRSDKNLWNTIETIF